MIISLPPTPAALAFVEAPDFSGPLIAQFVQVPASARNAQLLEIFFHVTPELPFANRRHPDKLDGRPELESKCQQAGT